MWSPSSRSVMGSPLTWRTVWYCFGLRIYLGGGKCYLWGNGNMSHIPFWGGNYVWEYVKFSSVFMYIIGADLAVWFFRVCELICSLYPEAWQSGSCNDVNGKNLRFFFLCSFFFLALLGIQIDWNIGIDTRPTSETSLNISVNFVCLHAVHSTIQM